MAQLLGKDHPLAHRVATRANQLSIEACRADDVSLMEEAISAASQLGSKRTPEEIVQEGLDRCARRNSLKVLQYLLNRGGDVDTLKPFSLMHCETYEPPSFDMLEMLVARGWDVNPRYDPYETPLLWLIVTHHDLVRWCLDHGARVDVPDRPPRINLDGTHSRTQRPRPTVLGEAASRGTVETFELLRAKGAPMDRRTLHLAVERATLHALKPGEGRNGTFAGSMDMVRHLVQVVGLDINADGRSVGTICTTPICHVAARPSGQDVRELVHYLLDHGADPDLDGGEEGATGSNAAAHWPSAMRCAEMQGNKIFLEAVEEWRVRKEGA